ncbi:MAG: hypothetical protein JWM68_4083 [Verrucomicrobiales bacterium]|nr:hypothetical protein [Verrucomicrobiales bacterium]
MKIVGLKTDLFLEAEEALRGLLAIEHRGRIPITRSNITCDKAKLEYLQKLAERAGLASQCEQHLAKVLIDKMENSSHTHLTIDDYALAVLKAVSEELTLVPSHAR